MQLRKLGRHWRLLSRLSSRTKHSMKSMLNAANIRGPKFDGASAQRWLLAHGDLLKPVQHDSFSDFIDILNLVERQRERLRRQLDSLRQGEVWVERGCRVLDGESELDGERQLRPGRSGSVETNPSAAPCLTAYLRPGRWPNAGPAAVVGAPRRTPARRRDR